MSATDQRPSSLSASAPPLPHATTTNPSSASAAEETIAIPSWQEELAKSRPQGHGRAKSDEAAYLERLRAWAKEKEIVHPGDGTLSAGFGPNEMMGLAVGGPMVMEDDDDGRREENLKYVLREDGHKPKKDKAIGSAGEQEHHHHHGVKDWWKDVRGKRKGVVFADEGRKDELP